MDLKLKGVTWVGNVYQKFEAVCHDVDEIVNQDTVKYVENRVQTVGESMKKFYSGLVQNILPPSVGPVKHETQVVPSKENAAYAFYSKSTTEIQENLLDTYTRQSSVEPYVINPVNELFNGASCLNELHCLNDLTPAPSMDPIEGSDLDSSSVQSDNVLTYENSDVNVEEHVTEKRTSSSDVPELFSPKTEDSYIDPIEGSDLDSSSVQSDNVLTYENSDVSVEEHVTEKRTSSSDVPELLSPKKKDFYEASTISGSSDKNHENGCGILASASPAATFYDTEFCVEEHVTEDKPSSSAVRELFSPKEDSCEASIISGSSEKSHENACGILPSVSSAASFDDTYQRGLTCHKLVNRAECISDVSSGIHSSDSCLCVASCKNRPVEMGLVSSSTSLSTESLCPSETSAAHITACVEKFGYNTGENEVSGCNSPTSQPYQFSDLAVNISGGMHVTETQLASSGSTMSIESFSGESGDFNDITDPSMESIELCDKVKLEDSCVVVDRSVPYALSCRAPKLISYKKKIMEVFASRKRLVKEYELLSILYGDIDLEFSQHTGQNMLSTSAEKLPMHDLGDSGWELL